MSKKITAIITTMALVTTSFTSMTLTGCAAGSADSNGEVLDAQDSEMAEFAGDSEESKELMSVMNSMSASGSSMAKKQETVYVKTSACGKVNEVVVSNWLKNSDGTKELIDSSDLNDIKNVKGHENYTTGDGIEVVWDANGQDIFYQGTTDKQLPVDVSISYKLDGQDIEPEELAGRSGHVEMVLNYVNHSENKVLIGDKEETIYTPFAVISGMMLDGEKFTNVVTTNGTVVSDGKNDVVVGMAFPGFVDSLNGSKVNDNEILNKLEDKIKIPSEVIVEADVHDFELGMTLTMISSDAMSALGLSDVDASIDTKDLESDLDEFEDAGKKLVDGTGKLKDGVQELSDGTSDMVSGTNDLYEGVKDYTDGVCSAHDGAIKLRDGSVDLDNGMTDLKKGIDKVNDGAGQLADGAKQVSDGVNTLIDKVGGISGNLGSAAQAAAQISGGIDMLAAATSAQTTADDVSDISVSVNASDYVNSDDVKSALNANLSDVFAAAETAGLTAEQEEAIINGITSYMLSGMSELASQAATKAARQAAVQAANNAKGQINAAITTPQAGSSASLKDGAAALKQGLASSAGGSGDDAASQAAQLKALKEGAASLASGAKTLKSGTQELSDGASKLKNGTCTLKDGLVELADGTAELAGHNSELVDGTKELADGSVDLVDGIAKLLDGSIELNDGMVRFDEEGIQKITSLFGTDVDTMNERIKAITDAGKSYKTFTGTSDEEDSSVRFILESEGIKL